MKPGVREQILAKVKQSTALRQGNRETGKKDARHAVPNWIPVEASWDEAAKELEALTDRFHLIHNPQELRKALADLVREHGISRAIRWDHPLLEKMNLDALLGECGVETTIPARERDGRALSEKADLGITAADGFVMESGTIVLRSRVGWGRSTSLLPPVHLAIVTSDRRLAKLDDLPGLINHWREEDECLPSGVTLITGHSRTADIELTLVSGVHGPRIVHVFGLDPLSFPFANG